jgi:hypothetical protein
MATWILLKSSGIYSASSRRLSPQFTKSYISNYRYPASINNCHDYQSMAISRINTYSDNAILNLQYSKFPLRWLRQFTHHSCCFLFFRDCCIILQTTILPPLRSSYLYCKTYSFITPFARISRTTETTTVHPLFIVRYFYYFIVPTHYPKKITIFNTHLLLL